MSAPYPNRDDGSSSTGAEARKKSSSWFSWWFENDNSDLKQQIHHKLNEFDDYQQRYERHNPFFWSIDNNPRHHHEQQQPTSSLQHEMEEFFESAGFGGLHHSPIWPAGGNMSTTSSSIRTQGGQYQMMRKEDQNGVQIDVQFPRKIEPESVSVEVLQEYPCIVQWKNQTSGKDVRDFRDRARLGESIDCSKLSASISTARNALTIEAPKLSSTRARGQEKPRSVRVTERDE